MHHTLYKSDFDNEKHQIWEGLADDWREKTGKISDPEEILVEITTKFEA